MEKRNTIQKKLVMDAVARLASHPTADEVYAEVIRTHPTVSKATVYRNLSSLSEDGRLRHIRMPNGADRFDHCLTEHRHVACVLCGWVRDVPVAEPETLDAEVAHSTGYTGVWHDIVYYGTCPACAAVCRPLATG